MKLNYRAATAEDIDLLAATRIIFLEGSYGELTAQERHQLRDDIVEYLSKALCTGSFVAYLAFDGEILAGTSGVCFYTIPPSIRCKNGKVAYIMNMYTCPEYRGNGIAPKLFEMVAEEAKRRECGVITLSATDMGRPIYEKFGFQNAETDMEYYL